MNYFIKRTKKTLINSSINASSWFQVVQKKSNQFLLFLAIQSTKKETKLLSQMPRRQSITSGYPNRPGTRILPPSHQPDPIPMNMRPAQLTASQERFPSMVNNNSYKNNRVAPPPMDYNAYPQPHHCMLFRI